MAEATTPGPIRGIGVPTLARTLAKSLPACYDARSSDSTRYVTCSEAVRELRAEGQALLSALTRRPVSDLMDPRSGFEDRSTVALVPSLRPPRARPARPSAAVLCHPYIVPTMVTNDNTERCLARDC